MGIVIGVDPGLRACGVAIVDARSGLLDAASLVRARPDLDEPEAWVEMAGAVADSIREAVVRWGAIDLLAVERQAIRMGGGGMSTKNPGQILGLAYVVGGIFASVRSPRIVCPYPQSWMGSKRPAGKTAGDLAWMALTEIERACAVGGERKSDGHNIHEAIGIAKWAQKKFRFNLL